MPNYTSNYNLTKPFQTDIYNIDVQNENWDKLDARVWDKHAKVINNGSDLNTYVEPGTYTYSSSSASGIANAPESVQSTLLVLPRLTANDNNNRIQIVITQSCKFYLRNLADGKWENWSGITTETGKTGRLVPDTCTVINDWNSATKTGWFMGNNALNAPTTSANPCWYFGYVIAHAANYVLQEVYLFSASANAVEIPKYIRANMNGTWGNWTEVTVKGVVPADLSKKLDNKLDKNPKFVEFNTTNTDTHGGYLDFKYAGDTSDFTSRIIEEEKGKLTFSTPNGTKICSVAPDIASVRNIYAGTAELEPGVSELPTGTIYFVYE